MRNICTIPGCEGYRKAHGFCSKHHARWLSTGDPLKVKRQANGSGTTTKAGYRIYGRVGQKKIREHVAIAERVLGRPLPAGAVVHHIDENPLNNRNSNLLICPSQSYHAEIHARLDALRRCGRADWRKCVYCHEFDDPQNMKRENSGRYVHGKCSADTRRKNWQRRQAAMTAGGSR